MSAMQLLAAQPWVERLGSTLLHSLWQGAMLAAVYTAARKCGARILGPHGRYVLACAALAAMTLVSVVTWISLGAAEPQSGIVVPPALHANAPGQVSGFLQLVGVAPFAAQGLFLSWVVAIWVAGAAAFSLRLLAGWILAQRLRYRKVRPAPAEWQLTFERLRRRASVLRPVRLSVSVLLDAPAAMGWLRPIVLAPAGALAGLPAAQMEALLLHELAHIRRHDYFVHVLQSAIETVFFYHPAVWWISNHMRAERELCCDDIVVSLTGDAIVYARALAELDAARWLTLTVAAANGGSLSARIARLLGRPPASPRASRAAAAPVWLVLAMGAWAVLAQPAALPHFEVASIKPSLDRGIAQVRALPGGLTADASLQILLQYAYGVQPFQVAGGPGWLGSDRYRIDAKANGAATRPQIFLMLQALIEDRFQLKVHRESRDQPAFALVADRGGPRLAPPKAGVCVESAAEAAPQWAGGRMAPPGQVKPAKGECGSAGVILGPNGAILQGGNLAMPELVRALSLLLTRGVIDRTGFTGRFDLAVNFVPDEATPAMPPPPPGSGMTGIPLPVALRQQLGLRLESVKAPVEVLVVDRAERPSAN
ncbi:MAG TPA: M56 family metallopeptidase [Bryobacteraceae bacterium]|jgi:uncharacterized protein (TIGR03435 family)|nr:M56 family metallopeptidase [Bryobacteraceae bacterium]